MLFKDYFKIAIKNLRTRPLRSWLTILSVVIGVFLIISILFLSEGIKTAVLKELKMFGKDVVMIMPGETSDIITTFIGGLKLSDDDIEAVKEAEGVDLVIPMTWAAEVMRYQDEKKTVFLYGMPWEEAIELFKYDMGWTVTKGRWPIPGEKELLVGNLVPKDTFTEMKVGTQATIKGDTFEIVGVLRSLGNKQDDSMIGLDLEIFREITNVKEGAQFAIARTDPNLTPDKVVQNIKDELDKLREGEGGEDLPPISVLSSETVTDVVSNIMTLIQALIFGLASVAIVVGGIGIMNTMYTAVYERTREIGIMKAVGAKNSTVTAIFLIESGIVGLVGGIGGVALGAGLAKLIELYLQIHPMFYLKAHISPALLQTSTPSYPKLFIFIHGLK